jgi:hypothetical protein
LTKIEVGSVEKVNAERWQVGPLDFLELSVRVDRTRLRRLKPISCPPRSRPASRSTTASSKTEQVLEVLVSRNR